MEALPDVIIIITIIVHTIIIATDITTATVIQKVMKELIPVLRLVQTWEQLTNKPSQLLSR